jgi:hypothetical protein
VTSISELPLTTESWWCSTWSGLGLCRGDRAAQRRDVAGLRGQRPVRVHGRKVGGRVNKWLTSMLVKAAGSASLSKNTYLATQQRGSHTPWAKRAQVAVAHSILVVAYDMLERDEPYRDLGPDWPQRRHEQAHTGRLVAQLECLGHTVVLDPVAWPGDRSVTTREAQPVSVAHAPRRLFTGLSPEL